MPARPKFTYVRSRALLTACRRLSCRRCLPASLPCEPAHSNWAVHGKSKGLKASDQYIAALCPSCHRELDQGSSWSDSQRKLIWWDAHVLTVEAMVLNGTWPDQVPIPDTSAAAALLFLGAEP